MLDRQCPPPATRAMARRIARRNGVRHAYTGNVHDLGRQSSYCHHCGIRTIGRDWYELSDWNLTAEGCCSGCGTRMAGVFEADPGDWGRRRRPVDPARLAHPRGTGGLDRQSVVWGKSVSVLIALGWRRLIKKKKNKR